MQESYWKQKVGYDWFESGDKNTRFFHSVVKGRRHRLKVVEFKINKGFGLKWGEIAFTAVGFFQKQFTQERDSTSFLLLSHIPKMVSYEENDLLCRIPDEVEVKKVVFNLKGESSSGPDGFFGKFFQVYWDIMGPDIVRMVQNFYLGNSLPKSITHTNLVLIPKKDLFQNFSDLRPISLSNFVYKIMSRIFHDRIEALLPKIISTNQSGFVKGRSIIENILLTQETVTDIGKRGKPANVVIKLDMEKAYDRVSWFFLMKVLRKIGFSENFVDMIWRLIANNYYSILINGKSHGFFHSTRGVKQGVPYLLLRLLYLLKC